MFRNQYISWELRARDISGFAEQFGGYGNSFCNTACGWDVPPLHPRHKKCSE
jgi:hypothetical protein